MTDRPLVDQPTPLPTRKLTVGLVVATAVQIAALWLPDADPRWAETIAILEPLVALLAGGAAAYFTRDRANT